MNEAGAEITLVVDSAAIDNAIIAISVPSLNNMMKTASIR